MLRLEVGVCVIIWKEEGEDGYCCQVASSLTDAKQFLTEMKELGYNNTNTKIIAIS